jgi:hypothetical protein
LAQLTDACKLLFRRCQLSVTTSRGFAEFPPIDWPQSMRLFAKDDRALLCGELPQYVMTVSNDPDVVAAYRTRRTNALWSRRAQRANPAVVKVDFKRSDMLEETLCGVYRLFISHGAFLP